MELSDILTRSLPLRVEWMGESFDFGYNPKGYDETLHVTLTRVQNLPDESPEKITVTADIITAMVVNWALTDHGQPVPVSDEWVRKLPALLRGAMVAAIMRDMSERRAESEDPKLDPRSSAGSSPAANGAAHPSGTASSEPPAGWALSPGSSAADLTPLAVTGGATGLS